MKRMLILPLLLGLLFVVLQPSAAQAQDAIENPDVVVEVDGLACPFCAYGIEKKLKKVEAIDQLAVHLEAGKIEIKLKEGETVSEERLTQAIADAGFEARTITFVNEQARAGAVPRGK